MFATTTAQTVEPTQLGEADYVQWQRLLEDTRPAPTALEGPDFGPDFTPPF
jgi:hypothetical protein